VGENKQAKLHNNQSHRPPHHIGAHQVRSLARLVIVHQAKRENVVVSRGKWETAKKAHLALDRTLRSQEFALGRGHTRMIYRRGGEGSRTSTCRSVPARCMICHSPCMHQTSTPDDKFDTML
jgi:hypothetical protein